MRLQNFLRFFRKSVALEGFEPSILTASNFKSDVYPSSTTEPYKKATPIITDWNGTTMKNTNHESYNMILTLCYFVA